MKPIDPIFDAVESFFVDYLQRTRGCTRCTLISYRDTLRLFLDYAAQSKKVPVDRLRLADFETNLVLAFLEHLESKRHNSIWLASWRCHPNDMPPHHRVISIRPWCKLSSAIQTGSR
jgi:site-specific recombinase XerC